MKNTCPQGDFGFFSARVEDGILVVQFKQNLLEHLSNLSKRDIITGFARKVLSDCNVKVILLNSDFRESGCEAYTRFFMKKSQAMENFDFHRLCNITSQLVQGILDLDRIVVHACQGNVISLFLNISLACDYRIASDDTVFCNPYIDLGLVPMGGGPYFLSKMMGTGKAWETLLLKKDIDAAQALASGLVDRVVPSADLEAESMEVARGFAANQSETIAGLKKLVNFSRKEISDYFELEKQQVLKIIETSDFLKRFGN